MSASSVQIKNIWMLSREYGDLAGAGGVKDVVKQLSVTLARWTRRNVHVVLPLYGFLNPQDHGFTPLLDSKDGTPVSFEVDMNYSTDERRETIVVWQTRVDRISIYLLASDRFAEKRSVYTYTPDEEGEDPWKKVGEGHYDYFAMNLLLQKGAIELMIYLNEKPDIIHCHDAHTAVLPALINECSWLRSYFKNTGTVVTIHNAGRGYHQEVMDLPYARAMTGLPMSIISKSLLSGKFDPFVAAGHYAIVNTVSDNYARELRETMDDELTDWLGHHLVKMGVEFKGVTNGIDPLEFDTRDSKKTGIAGSFDILKDSELKGKELCKKDLLHQINQGIRSDNVQQIGTLKDDVTWPLLTFIGRLSQQKGIDVLIPALEKLVKKHEKCNVVLLGTGGIEEEQQLLALVADTVSEERICFLRGFDSKLANKVYAAGDFMLIPSRYEPCGLTDFIAQLFGNLPIVHHVGGLVKILDGRTGFAYKKESEGALLAAIMQALGVYEKKDELRQMQRQAVTLIHKKYIWTKVMKEYVKLYRQSLSLRLSA